MVKEEIIKNLPLEKKIALCSGASFWQTEKMEEYGIDSIFMADGPHGLRKQINTNDMLGINRSVAATCFPAEVLTACSFDESLLRRIGQAIAIEAKANEVNVVLGPGANIKRNPLCGRNFEYFSEDPLLSGKMAAAFIQGVENEGVGSSLKHFALNSQEYRRFVSDSVVDERTMHEIYLKSFEIAVKEGKPSTVMSSYNKVNGISSSSNPYLLTDILRKQWGFDGLVVTDWGAMKDRIASFKAGCDLCMPGGSAYMEKEAMDAVKQGTLNEKQIDQSVERVLNLIEKTKLSTKTTADLEAHHQLACEVVKESAVLLKNEDKILPLDNLNDVAIIGQFASAPRYQGSGSSHINPYKMTSVMDTVPSAQYAQGYNEDGTTKDSLIEEAKEIARNKKAVLIFAGLTDRVESEGFERDDMKMSDGHNRLIEEVAKINKNTVVILFSGSAVELPWEKDVKAILYAGLPGQASGQALVDLLTGKANPSGKLAETWPMRYEDCISSTYYGTQQDAHYREGLYVGYRYYHSANISVKYPFGHGLSYASFEYSNLKQEGRKITFDLTNTSDVEGKEIVQCYIEALDKNHYHPKVELKAFKKIKLMPHQTKKVTFELKEEDFSIYCDGWKILESDYRIHIGSSSSTYHLSTTLHIKGEQIQKGPQLSLWYFTLKGIPSHADFESLVNKKVITRKPKKGEYTMENTVMQMKEDSWIMRVFYHLIEWGIAIGLKCKVDYSNHTFKMMVTQALDCSLCAMKINAGMKNYLFEGLLEMANGHYLKGIKKVLFG